MVLVAAFTYRSFGSAETATGSLTLEQPAPAPGDRAPEFTTRTAEGERFTLTDEGVYVLSFWSTLNESSNKAKPGFAELANEYGNDEASFAAVSGRPCTRTTVTGRVCQGPHTRPMAAVRNRLGICGFEPLPWGN